MCINTEYRLPKLMAYCVYFKIILHRKRQSGIVLTLQLPVVVSFAALPLRLEYGTLWQTAVVGLHAEALLVHAQFFLLFSAIHPFTLTSLMFGSLSQPSMHARQSSEHYLFLCQQGNHEHQLQRLPGWPSPLGLQATRRKGLWRAPHHLSSECSTHTHTHAH